eukprot:6178507-Pleurochrysis_carterae.AAC.2
MYVRCMDVSCEGSSLTHMAINYAKDDVICLVFGGLDAFSEACKQVCAEAELTEHCSLQGSFSPGKGHNEQQASAMR